MSMKGKLTSKWRIVTLSIACNCAYNTKDEKTDSLVTSITFVVIALRLQISEEYKHLG
jgi:hypothetical protein